MKSTRLEILTAIIMVIMIMIIITATISSLLVIREKERNDWKNEIGSMSLVLSEQTDQTLLSAMTAMDSIVESLKPEEKDIKEPQEKFDKINRGHMQNIISGLPQIDSVMIANTEGKIVLATKKLDLMPEDITDEEYFKIRKSGIEEKYYVGSPTKNTKTMKWTIPLSERVVDNQGKLIGVAVVNISVEVLNELFGQVSRGMGEGAAVTFLRKDYTTLARYPFEETMEGKKIMKGVSHYVVSELNETAKVVSTDIPRYLDQNLREQRISGIRVQKKFPTIINLTVMEKHVLAGWRSVVWFVAIIAAITTIVLAMATLLLLRMIGRKEQSSALLKGLTSQLQGSLFKCISERDDKITFLYGNESFNKAHGVKDSDYPVIGEKILGSIYERDAKKFMEEFKSKEIAEEPIKIEYRIKDKEGKIVWHHCDATPERQKNGSTIWHGYIQDVSERKQAEQDQSIAAVAFNIQEGIIITDDKFNILRINSTTIEITGYSTSEVVGKPPHIILGVGKQEGIIFKKIKKELKECGRWQGEIRNRTKNGKESTIWLIISAVKDEEGHTSNFVMSFTDITDRKATQEKIYDLAYYDHLTALPNRRLLTDRLRQAIKQSDRKKSYGALFFIDLDNFKSINDTLGRDAGDELLQGVSKNILSTIRDSDTLARLGGDEFVIMLTELGQDESKASDQSIMVADKIKKALEIPQIIKGFNCQTTASIGIALFNGSKGASIETLMKQADLAMYRAKNAGKNNVQFFSQEMQDVATSRLILENDLKIAILKSQFQLYYQPIVNANREIIGAESLIRWNHPKHGIIQPDDFIPFAEETNLIIPIGLWVIKAACSQISIWSRTESTRNLTVAINISQKQMKSPEFVEQVTSAIREAEIDPTRLKIEITESLLMEDSENTIRKIKELKEKNIAFSLDDFGTGYSSLSYLRRMPLDNLKIDRSFVNVIPEDNEAKTIAKAIIKLSESLGMNVIAEGVEREDQWDFLIKAGCTEFQGYLFGKPVVARDFGMKVEENNQK